MTQEKRFPEPPDRLGRQLCEGQGQPDVIYRPLCKSNLCAIEKKEEKPAHMYICRNGHIWEINQHGHSGRKWNGSWYPGIGEER